jgi:hypothetical protein
MNERIRKLADRACEYADYDPGYMPDKFLMKFTELVYEELSKDADEWYEKMLWDKK